MNRLDLYGLGNLAELSRCSTESEATLKADIGAVRSLKTALGSSRQVK
jgi:hypothetical protein